MKARLAILGVALIVLASMLAPVAQAHSTAGIPYHTAPAPAPPVLKYADGACMYNFYNPTVLGFTREYVYWRPIGAFVANNAWQYRYGEWRRALTSPTQMTYGWESQQWPTNAWLFSNGVSGVLMPPGSSRWLGYQIFYGSNSHTHTEWLGAVNC